MPAVGESFLKVNKANSGLVLFLAAFFLYAAVSPGNLPGDTEVRWSVSRQILRHGTVALEDSVATRNCAVGVDGRRYTFYGLGQSICFLPLAGVGLLLEKFTSVSAETSDLLAQFAASTLLFPALGALLVLAFYRLVLLLGASERTGIVTALVFAFATMTLHYSVVTQEQTQVALCLMLATIFMVKNQGEGRWLFAWLLCVMLGVAIFFRLTAVVVAVPIFLVAMVAEMIAADDGRWKVFGKWIGAGVLGVGGFIAFWGWYNYARFGSVFETGYALSTETSLGGHALFEGNGLVTLLAMWFSPGKSILLYNPVLLLLPFCGYAFFRKHRTVAIAGTLAIVSNFVFHSLISCWAGDYAWGARFQMAIVPFLVLPLYVLFERSLGVLSRWLVVGIAASSCVIQLASVVYNFNLEFVQNSNHSIIPTDYVWDWRQSHLVMRINNIAGHITNSRDFSTAEVIDENPLELRVRQTEEFVRRTYKVNWFPFKAASNLASTKIFYGLLGMWIVLLGGCCYMFRILMAKVLLRRDAIYG